MHDENWKRNMPQQSNNNDDDDNYISNKISEQQ